jgi:hypothetical protein
MRDNRLVQNVDTRTREQSVFLSFYFYRQVCALARVCIDKLDKQKCEQAAPQELARDRPTPSNSPDRTLTTSKKLFQVASGRCPLLLLAADSACCSSLLSTC